MKTNTWSWLFAALLFAFLPVVHLIAAVVDAGTLGALTTTAAVLNAFDFQHLTPQSIAALVLTLGGLGVAGGHALETFLENVVMNIPALKDRPGLKSLMPIVFSFGGWVIGGLAGGLSVWQSLIGAVITWGQSVKTHNNPATTSADWALPKMLLIVLFTSMLFPSMAKADVIYMPSAAQSKAEWREIQAQQKLYVEAKAKFHETHSAEDFKAAWDLCLFPIQRAWLLENRGWFEMSGASLSSTEVAKARSYFAHALAEADNELVRVGGSAGTARLREVVTKNLAALDELSKPKKSSKK